MHITIRLATTDTIELRGNFSLEAVFYNTGVLVDGTNLARADVDEARDPFLNRVLEEIQAAAARGESRQVWLPNTIIRYLSVDDE